MADVIASTPPEKLLGQQRNEWPVAYIFRPIAIRLCPLFHALGFSPSGVTLLALAVTLLLPFSLVFGGTDGDGTGGIPGALLLALGMAVFEILDYVDGSLARVTGNTTPAGGFLDSFTDIVHKVVVFAVLGGLVAQTAPESLFGLGGHGVAVGMGAACFVLVARLSRNLAEEGEQNAVFPFQSTENLSTGERVFHVLAGLEYAVPFILPVAALFNVTAFVLGGWFVYAFGDLALTLILVWRRYR